MRRMVRRDGANDVREHGGSEDTANEQNERMRNGYFSLQRHEVTMNMGMLFLGSLLMVGLIGSSKLSGIFMSRTGRYKHLPIMSSGILSVGAMLLGTLSVDTPFALIVIYMFLVGIGIGPVMSVGVGAIQNAVPHQVLGVATASAQMFRQIGGSLGVAVLGAIFANRLAYEATAIGHPEGTAGFNADVLAAMPAPEQAAMLEAYVAALHPIYWVAAAAALVAFVLGWFLVEIPLATKLHKSGPEPDAEPQAAE